MASSPSIAAVEPRSVRLDLLGACALHAGTSTLPFPPERCFQLLAWLACQRAWVPRERAMALFWPDKDAAAARRNLRGVLHELRRLPWAPQLDTAGELVRWLVETDHALFARALDEGDFAMATRLVRGPFADGLEAGAPESFAEWLRFERENVLNRWRSAVSSRLAQIDDVAAREAFAAHALDIDPLNEELAHAEIASMAALGRGTDALLRFRAFERRLADEAGVPVPARLAAFVRDLAAGVSRIAVDPRGAGAANAESERGFFGRRIECRELVALVRRGECRWATLLGPGGIGKSRLARVVAARLADGFAAGITWVELRDLESVAQVPARLAAATGVRGHGAGDDLAQVARALGDARILLVLDNAEHLDGLGALAESLVADCPGVVLLVTSRVRFGHHAEWVFPLEGLPLPDADEGDLDVLRSFDAIALFEARARAADAGFDLQAQAVAARDLVRAVGGSPLAIELAAASVRTLPVAAILAALLAAPEGDDALRASFLRSWNLLSQAERTALARLSVFAGPFSPAAAHQVAHASLPMLTALADKSLLRSAEGARLSLHPLVRQFAAERLGDAPDVRTRHATWYASWFAAATRDGATAVNASADEALADGIAALRWACERLAVATIVQLAAPLRAVLDETGRWTEGWSLFRTAAETVAAGGSATAAAQAELQRALAMFCYRRGDLDRAESCARQALRLATALRSRRGLDACLNLIGGAHRQRGEWALARRYFERALARAQADGNPELVLRVANNLATVEMATGRPERAVSLCRDLLAHADEAADPLGVAMTLLILGNAQRASAREGEAEQTYEQGLRHARRQRLATILPYFLQALGTVTLDRQDVARAVECFRESLTAGGEAIEPHVEASARLGLARAAIAGGRARAAFAELRLALSLAQRMRSATWQAAVVLRWGEALVAGGDTEAGARLLAIAATHPAQDASVRAEAGRAFERLPLDVERRTALLREARHADLSAESARLAG